MMRYQVSSIALLLVSFLAGAPAPASQNQIVAVHYSAAQLNCARFIESGESKILTQSGGRGREQTSGRSAVWQFRASPSSDGVALEGWLDSLALWRRSAETTISPDTDGLLGGRFRGTLSGDGAYSSQVRPFIPDEVKEVARMETALDDFFPPLAPRPLAAGEAWNDSIGVTIRRISDSAMSGVSLFRFELESRRERYNALVPGDTVPLQLREVSQEHGTFVWHPLLGLLRRDRRIVVETSLPAGRTVRQPVRSKIEQRITILRDLTVPPEEGGRCRRRPGGQ